MKRSSFVSRLLIKLLVALVLLVPIWFWQSATRVSPSSALRLSFLNVGQGDAVYLETSNEVRILNDGGPDEKVVSLLDSFLPLFDRHLNLMILSHPHADHLTGLLEVLRRYQVGSVIDNGGSSSATYKEWLDTLQQKKIQPLKAYRGDRFRYDDLLFEVLWPPSADWVAQAKNPNDYSLVILVSYQKFSCLLPGDIDVSVEAQISLGRQVEVLKSPHHGSTSSLSLGFLDMLQPRLLVISVGHNSYGQPAENILNLANSRGIRILRTDKDDTINIYTDGDKWWVK
ncbi:MAG: MBL fold metallo-hydrolase [bacterium]|nr:MBL fold metallo-hydrolase [bacterium]